MVQSHKSRQTLRKMALERILQLKRYSTNINKYRKLSLKICQYNFCTRVYFVYYLSLNLAIIQIVLEFQRCKSVKVCRPKARQAKVNANSSTNSLKSVKVCRPIVRQAGVNKNSRKNSLKKFNNWFYNMSLVVRIGTRGSVLARWQSGWCLDRLKLLGVSAEEIVIQTSGDSIQDSSIIDIGAQGVFTKEIQRSLLRGEIDVAVHSLKDLPTDFVEGLELSIAPCRGSYFDVFIGLCCNNLDELPEGSRIGTGSLRRKTQIINRYGDKFKIDEIRGNVETRLRKLDAGEYDAIILAAAGLERLGLADRIGAVLKPPFFLPAVGQGVIGLEIRSGDIETAAKIKPLGDPLTLKAALAERAMLRRLRGGCIVPIAAICKTNENMLTLHGRILSMDGKKMIENIQITPAQNNPETLGISVAENLIKQGANKFLNEIEQYRKIATVHENLNDRF
jgi:hydroxymethylbilane synthase